MIDLPALGPKGEYRARNRLSIEDVAGWPVASLSIVPSLFVGRAMSALRKASSMARGVRLTALAEAGRLFGSGVVDGMDAAEYQYLVSRMSGLPLSVVRASSANIASRCGRAYRSVHQARPVGAVADWWDPSVRGGRGVWVRRGDVFAVHAAGNHPGVHALWIEALALGYRVAVRPSRREPLTPYRLVAALRAAGFGDDQVVLLPTDHAVAGEVLRGADLGMVYGGQDVVDKYCSDPAVLPNGPGRSKVLLGADVDWREHLDMVVASVCAEGGAACVNATAVLVEGDPAPVAAALAERLGALPSLAPEDEKAVLPVTSVEGARRMASYVGTTARGARAHLAEASDPLPGGGAVLRPVVYEVDSARAPAVQVELPFPCVWVAPWRRSDGVGPLRNSLVVTAVTEDFELVDSLVAEPSISNVYVGDHPTQWMSPDLPHDGYLGEFLMQSKGVVRSSPTSGAIV